MGNKVVTRAAIFIFPVLGLMAAAKIYSTSQNAVRPRTSEALSSALTEYSFVELRPPSTLLAPGTWVEVVGTKPLQLGIICQPAEALGDIASGATAWSTSTNITLTSSLQSSFVMDAAALQALRTNSKLEPVKNINFTLKNVKVLEIPDSAVFSGFAQRTLNCRNAIEFRLKQKNPVSMIKSILYGDADYTVEYEERFDAVARAQAAEELAAEFSARVDLTNHSHISGASLVWGVRDDPSLARFGYDLPSTGAQAPPKSELLGKGPAVDIAPPGVRRKESHFLKTLAHIDGIEPLKQPTAMSCWATTYAMLKAWKNSKPYTPLQAVQLLGQPYEQYFAKDEGLPAGHETLFIEQAGMRIEPPANYTPKAFVRMLKEFGPLWIIVGNGLSSHALLLTAIYGTSLDDTMAAYKDAKFEFIDPATGQFAEVPALQFLADFEREAGVFVAAKKDFLRWQVIHW